MRFNIISIGRVKQPFVKAAESEYLQRIKPYAKVSLSELDYAANNLNEAARRKKETEKLLAAAPKATYLIALDEDGKQFSSEELAAFLQTKMNQGHSDITFAIGGAFGFDKSLVKQHAKLVLSLSPLTFSYQSTRMILVEQLYRVLSIIHGLPYHKA